MKFVTVIVLALLSVSSPAMAGEESRVNEAINKWFQGKTSSERSSLIERTQDLGVLWVTGQINQEEFCKKAAPLEKEVKALSKKDNSTLKSFYALTFWCPDSSK